MLRLFRELDDAVCRMRFNEEEIGLWLFSSEGDPARVTDHDSTMARLAGSDWFAREIILHAGRTLHATSPEDGGGHEKREAKAVVPS